MDYGEGKRRIDKRSQGNRGKDGRKKENGTDDQALDSYLVSSSLLGLLSSAIALLHIFLLQGELISLFLKCHWM